MPVLDEHEGSTGAPKLKLLLPVANNVLIPSQRVILTELDRLRRDTINPKWMWRWEEDGEHSRYLVFKSSIKEGIMDQEVSLTLFVRRARFGLVYSNKQVPGNDAFALVCTL